jgi:hypothetical protein
LRVNAVPIGAPICHVGGESSAKKEMKRFPEIAIPEHGRIHSWTVKDKFKGQHDNRNNPDVLSSFVTELGIDDESHGKCGNRGED